MTDIIWGNGSEVLTTDSFVLNVTHRKDGNKENYSDIEKIRIIDVDIPGLPENRSEWNIEILSSCTKDAFLKCEVNSRNQSGILLSKVSHSGAGGY
jgi:hypothetical protein